MSRSHVPWECVWRAARLAGGIFHDTLGRGWQRSSPRWGDRTCPPAWTHLSSSGPLSHHPTLKHKDKSDKTIYSAALTPNARLSFLYFFFFGCSRSEAVSSAERKGMETMVHLLSPLSLNKLTFLLLSSSFSLSTRLSLHLELHAFALVWGCG